MIYTHNVNQNKISQIPRNTSRSIIQIYIVLPHCREPFFSENGRAVDWKLSFKFRLPLQFKLLSNLIQERTYHHYFCVLARIDWFAHRIRRVSWTCAVIFLVKISLLGPRRNHKHVQVCGGTRVLYRFRVNHPQQCPQGLILHHRKCVEMFSIAPIPWKIKIVKLAWHQENQNLIIIILLCTVGKLLQGNHMIIKYKKHDSKMCMCVRGNNIIIKILSQQTCSWFVEQNTIERQT